jgi:hypothetical protein
MSATHQRTIYEGPIKAKLCVQPNIFQIFILVVEGSELAGWFASSINLEIPIFEFN